MDTHNHSAREQMAEHLKKYEDHFYTCLEKGKKNYPGDFYIVVLQKRESLMEKKISLERPIDGVLRRYFIVRQSCPTPNYDQTVYRYSKADDKHEFIWTIPDRPSAWFLKENYLSLDPEYQALVQFIFAFDDGTLLKLAQKLNGEDQEAH